MTFKKQNHYIALCFILVSFVQCSVTYNFTGGNVGNAKTYMVRFIQNRASDSPGSTIEPNLDRDFTRELQDLIANQTSLAQVSNNADLTYEGEIVEYRIAPMTATADQRAAQNRLTMTVNIRFFNNTEENKDFEKRFTSFYDFDATTQLLTVKDAAHEDLFERILQDIFVESIANW